MRENTLNFNAQAINQFSDWSLRHCTSRIKINISNDY